MQHTSNTSISNTNVDKSNHISLFKATYESSRYILYIKINSDSEQLKTHYNNLVLKSQHHTGDSGIDLYNNCFDAEPFSISTIDFGISCQMLDTERNKLQSYYLLPRSSLAKTDFQLANSIGLIDAGYVGNILAKVRGFSTQDSIAFPEGSYFQIVSPDLKPIKVCIVDELQSSSRTSGFGSTK